MIDWHRDPLPGDWAARPMYRISNQSRTAIMLETVPDNDPNAIEGHRVAPVAALYRFLHDKGVKTPEVFEADPQRGILIMEDFGDVNWERALASGDDPAFYDAALSILQQFKTIKPDAAIDLPEFQNSYIFGRTIWYLDHYKKITDKTARRDFLQIWDGLLETLRHDEPVHFVHGDFRPGNLMKLDDGGTGVIDVGGAFWGSGLYDLVNLLEDLRRDVPDDVRTEMKTRYGASEDAYAILHAQFYIRLCGQMTRRGMPIPRKLPLALQSLVHRFDVLKPLKTLVLS